MTAIREDSQMESHEVLRVAIQKEGAKALAAELGVSTSLVYKWCEPKATATDPGAGNPLDRLLKICQATGDVAPVQWLCGQTNGFRVDNPETTSSAGAVLKSTQVILKEFSEVLEAVSGSYGNGNRIDCKEATHIRKEWEELKSIAESFVVACEAGCYDREGA